MNRSICSGFVRGAMAWAFLVIASVSFAQDHSIADAKGTQQHRDYFSQLPFEQIDTATGALVLTFTDLVLPGARGRDLKFQRIYNSKDNKWRFAIAGYPLYIRDPAFAPSSVDMQTIEGAYTPSSLGTMVPPPNLSPRQRGHQRSLQLSSPVALIEVPPRPATLTTCRQSTTEHDEPGRLVRVPSST